MLPRMEPEAKQVTGHREEPNISFPLNSYLIKLILNDLLLDS